MAHKEANVWIRLRAESNTFDTDIAFAKDVNSTIRDAIEHGESSFLGWFSSVCVDISIDDEHECWIKVGRNNP